MPVNFIIQLLSSGTGNFGPGTFTRLRILFGSEILNNSDVTNIINYSIVPTGPSTIVPAIISAGFDDESHESIVLVLAQPFTYGKVYSISIFSLVDVTGDPVMAAAVNFTASIVDPPKIIAAFPSDHRVINLVFDRPIDPAFVPFAFIRDANAFVLPIPCAFTFNLFPRPSNIVRFVLPIFMPIATDFIIDFEGIIDYSLNSSDDLDTAIALCNQIKKEYNDHRTQFGVHPVDDIINFVILADATNLISAMALVNDLKSKFNAHRIELFVHIANDTVNIVQHPNAIDLHTLVTLVNELRDRFNDHRTRIGSHVNDDLINIVTNTKAVGSVPLSYSLRSLSPFGFVEFDQIQIIHAAFRSQTLIRVHFNCPTDISFSAWSLTQDSVHLINDGINVITSADAAGIWVLGGSLDTLLSELKTDFNLHIKFPQFHELMGTEDLIIGDLDGTLAGAIILVNEIASKYETHRVRPGIHLADDVLNFLTVTNPATNNVEANDLANNIKLNLNLHRVQTNVPVPGILINNVNPDDDSFGPFVNYVDVTSPISLNPRATFRITANGVLSLDGFSVTSMFNYTGDINFPGFGIPANLLNYSVYTDSFIKLGFDKALSDPDGIIINAIGSDSIPIRHGLVTQISSLNDVMSLANELRTQYNIHRIVGGLHQNNDTVNTVISPPASNLGNTRTLLNEIKTKFNLHNASQAFHVHSDIVNEIVSSNAIDLVSLQNLVNELKQDFNDHRILTGVHIINDLINIVISPDAFDLPSSIASVNAIRTNYESHRINVAFHVVADFQNNIVSPLAFDLGSAQTLANELKTKFNSHQRPVHRIIDPNLVTAASAIDLNSCLALALNIQELFNAHQINVSYHFFAGNNLSVLLISDGIMIGIDGMKNQFGYHLFVEDFIDKSGNTFDLDRPFIGIATRPSLASVIPKLALMAVGERTDQADDSISLGFSKSMGSSSISNANFILTGGAMILTDFEWNDSDTITIYVNNMESVVYNIQAINLFDEAGNQIY